MGTQPTAWTYAQAGVDLNDVALLKRRIATLAAQTFTPGVVGGIGHFGGFFRAPGENMLLVSSVDSVGTKVLLAALLERYEGLGVDIVHHCINDVLACGARPLFFLDYLGLSRLEPAAVEAIVRGITYACREAGCALIGGETAQLPGLYREGASDIVGCIIGTVPADRVLDGSAVRAGDVLVGLPSNGLHTNGYSLVRAVLGLDDPERARALLAEQPSWAEAPLGEVLLRPHRSYLSLVLPLLDAGVIHALAHITGGGICENLARVIPSGLQARVRRQTWPVPPLFSFLQERGQIPDEEMARVFNLGIGYVLVVDAQVGHALPSQLGEGWVIGDVVASAHDVPRAVLIS